MDKELQRLRFPTLSMSALPAECNSNSFISTVTSDRAVVCDIHRRNCNFSSSSFGRAVRDPRIDIDKSEIMIK